MFYIAGDTMTFLETILEFAHSIIVTFLLNREIFVNQQNFRQLNSVQFYKKLSFKVSLEVSKNIFKSRLKVS